MKTFKLVSLQILEKHKEEIRSREIPLLDGLIIHRESKKTKEQWIIEAYIKRTYELYLRDKKKCDQGMMIKAKISKESNKPALFVVDLLSINDIGKNINVLFQGAVIDLRSQKNKDAVRSLLKKDYYGKELLEKFVKL